MRKCLGTLGVDGNQEQKSVNKKFTANLTVNGDTLNAFYLNFGIR